MEPTPEELRLFTPEQIRSIAEQFGTPLYVYSEKSLRATASAVLAFPNAFGLTARFAMKANPNASIIKLFTKMGLHIDASSEYEVRRALGAGVPAANILLTAQESTADLAALVEAGVQYTATSFEQLEQFGRQFPGGEVSIRINPGLGSGGTKRTNVGGPASSFGIWHEQIDRVQQLVAAHKLNVKRIHTHIGSGSDPEVWQKISAMSISLLHSFPTATVLNLGGGFKVGRMNYEFSADLQKVGQPIAEAFRHFARETGREIKLEIGPGTFLVANTGCLLSKIDAVSSTGSEGYSFYKINSGMTELMRPAMYGAQHPIVVVPATGPMRPAGEFKPALVVGHCCESGDIFTPAAGDPEGLTTRMLSPAAAGDYVVVEGTGAYGAGFSAVNYNSFPEAAQVLVRENGQPQLIRKRQQLSQVIANEVLIDDFA